MKSGTPIPQISIPPLKLHLSGESPIGAKGQYSILKNARRDESEIAEIAYSLGSEYIADLVTFSPRRLGFFETIVTVETEIKMRNDEDLALIVHKVYNDHVVPLLKTKDADSGKKLEDKILEETEKEILEKVNLAFADFEASEFGGDAIDRSKLSEDHQIFLNEIRKIYNKIKLRIDKGLYIPGEYSFTDDHNSITKKIVFDKFYNKIMSKRINDLVQTVILELLESKSVFYPHSAKTLARLSCHQGSNRHTFMMTGAPGSGKGTLFGMIAIDARNFGIEMSDVVKCNIDSYRNLVSNEKELGPHQIHHAGFNADETYLVTRMVYNCLKEKIQGPKGAPHILLDTVCITQEKINLGIMREGQLHLNCVSVPVEISLKRAFLRGKMTGRYVDTSYLLKAHRDISANFHRILIDNKDNSIDYVLVDNNVPPGEFPILVAEGNLGTKTIKIHDLTRLKQFIEKENVNIETTETLHSMAKDQSDVQLLGELRRAGFEIECNEESKNEKAKMPHVKKMIKSNIRVGLERRSNQSSNNSLRAPRKKGSGARLVI